MLPKMNGYDVCKEISMTKEIPIIFLTAKNEMIDKVLGLEIGGDDYLTKPFDTRELLARIKALLRRSKKKNTSRETSPDNNTPLVADSIKNAELQIFLKERTVLINNEEIHLTPKEFDLLYLLMDNLEQVFSREILLEKIWGYDYYGGTRTVDMHIRRLRKKIEITDKKYIQTVFGVGYKMKKF
jgi:two-component system response regulator VicR